MWSRNPLALGVALVACAPACHNVFDGVFPYVCPAADPTATARLPDRLSATGLYAAGAAGTASQEIAAGILAYTPQFQLWADGATKRRWLWLPPGSTIDDSDPDDWLFPVGTKVWKEFSRDGMPIETRLIAKVGTGKDNQGEWIAQAYLWTDDGADAVATPEGYVDARNTTHDVPAAGECVACHGGRRSFVLGVSAIQLAGGARPGEVDLASLVAAGRLTGPYSQAIVVPGDEQARLALGYLHANCGHCHNSDRSPNKPCFVPDNALDFWLRLDHLGSVDDTPTLTSAGDAIRPGNPDGSEVVQRISTRALFSRMPPLGTRRIDDQGIAQLRAWIAELP